MHKRLLLILAGLSLLAGCGGGSGSSAAAANTTQNTDKSWVRAHLDDVYLWYDEIVDVPSANYPTAPAYFDGLLVKTRDRFSFSMPLAEAVSTMQEGLDTGYGVRWGWGAAGRLYAYYVDPSSPAAASIVRGTEVTAINGKAVTALSSSELNSALLPGQPGTSVNLTCRAPGTTTTQTKGLTSATFSTTTVGQPLILTLPGGGKAGYLLFNEHLFTAEQALTNAMTYFKQQGIAELVLDMRYNPGGYLFIAEELASMIGGTAVQGKVFEKLRFNGRHPEKTSDPDSTCLFSAQDRNGASLPMLGLGRVFVLTGSSTCSASEAVINGLLPYLQVIRIGKTTCGKPYGFVQTNHDQQAYFAIQFEGVNADGTDNFMSGFAPTCQVADDLNYPLGDSREARLNAALYYMSNSSCPPATTVSLPKAVLSGAIPDSGDVQLIGQKPGLKLLR
jgi:carboxyl-terminal processing protease